MRSNGQTGRSGVGKSRGHVSIRAAVEALEVRRLLSAAVWTGSGGDGQWSNAANWSAHAVPTAGQDVQFPATTATTQVTLASNVDVGNVELDGNYDIQGSTITLSGNVTSTGSTSQLISHLDFTQSPAITVGSSDELNIYPAGSDDNGFGLIKEGGGTLFLAGSGAGGLSGPIEVAGGTIGEGAAVTISSVFTVGPGATLEAGAVIGGIIGNGGTVAALNGPGAQNVVSAGSITLGSSDTVAASVESQFGPGNNRAFSVIAEGSSSAVNLGGASFDVDYIQGAVPTVGEVVTIIANQTGNAVVGTFAGLSQGDTTTIAGVTYQISYTGGSGHDVTATVESIPRYWTGTGGDGLWSDAANWQGDTVPASGANIVIDNSSNPSAIDIDVDQPVNLGSLTAGNVNLTGDTITFSGSGQITGNDPIYILDPIALDVSITVKDPNANFVFGSPISDNGGGFGITFTGNSSAEMAPWSFVHGEPVADFSQTLSENYTGNTQVTGFSILYYNADFPGALSVNDGNLMGRGQALDLINNEGPSAASSLEFVGGNSDFPDTLTVDHSVDIAPISTVNFEIGGTAAGDGTTANSSSRIVVDASAGGAINVENAQLDATLLGNYVPQRGDVIALIDNQTGTPVQGNFVGYPQGAVVAVGQYDFTISYRGGANHHDVTLTAMFPDHLAFAQPPSASAVAGDSLGTISVDVADLGGGVVTNDSSTVTLTAQPTIGGSASALTGNATVAAHDGVATFTGLSLADPGTYTLTATDGTLTPTSTTITVTAVPPVPNPSSDIIAGQLVAPSLITPTTQSVGLSPSTHHVTVRFENTADGGKGSFTRRFGVKAGSINEHHLRFDKAGLYNETITSHADPAMTQQLTVVPAAPSKLLFSQEPASRTDAAATVAVTDRFGNLTPADNGQTITLRYPDHPHPDHHRILTGTTATITAGTATFSTITLTAAGETHLVATAGPLRPGASRMLYPSAA